MIQGKFVGLQAIEENDLSAMLAWRNNPSLRKYFREYREINLTQQKKWFEQISKKDFPSIMFAIVDKNNNELLGAGGLCYINWLHRNAEISLYIGKNNSYIDDIFAPDAAKTIIEYGFNEVGLHKIWTEVYDFDISKQKLLEKLCFVKEGLKRESYWLNGEWHNALVYSLLKSEHEGIKHK